MLNKQNPILMKEEIIKNGFTQLTCDDVEEFIYILKIIEGIDDITVIPGINISKATNDDNLNEGESLNDLFSGEVGHYCKEVNDGDIFINNSELIGWADQFLISTGGSINFQNISIMRHNGFNVRPGEADSFGWLTGVIKTKKGELVFG